MRFSQVRAAFNGIIGRQSKELAERMAAGDAAAARLRRVDLIKRGFFNNLVMAISEPLQAVSGHLAALKPALNTSNDPALAGRLDFPVAELHRLGRLVDDYHQIALFRQNLVTLAAPLCSLADIVALTLEDDLAVWRRLPQLTIGTSMRPDLPTVRADADMLRRAIGSLAGHGVHQAGQGSITIAGAQDAERFIATESFGRKALFACQAHNATVSAETAVLAYEFDRRALARLLAETPELAMIFATSLANVSWRDGHPGHDGEVPAGALERLVNTYRGQMEANHTQQSVPRLAS